MISKFNGQSLTHLYSEKSKFNTVNPSLLHISSVKGVYVLICYLQRQRGKQVTTINLSCKPDIWINGGPNFRVLSLDIHPNSVLVMYERLAT